MHYPRMCGGTFILKRQSLAMIGLSPRVRGNLYTEKAKSGHDRTIPACAGEPIIEISVW